MPPPMVENQISLGNIVLSEHFNARIKWFPTANWKVYLPHVHPKLPFTNAVMVLSTHLWMGLVPLVGNSW